MCRMNGGLSHNSALEGCAGKTTTWEDMQNFGMNHARCEESCPKTKFMSINFTIEYEVTLYSLCFTCLDT